MCREGPTHPNDGQQGIRTTFMSGSVTTARGWELDVIASVIIGGTSLMGGKGKIRGTLMGVIFLGILVNGMTLMNINEYRQHVVRGALHPGRGPHQRINERSRD